MKRLNRNSLIFNFQFALNIIRYRLKDVVIYGDKFLLKIFLFLLFNCNKLWKTTSMGSSYKKMFEKSSRMYSSKRIYHSLEQFLSTFPSYFFLEQRQLTPNVSTLFPIFFFFFQSICIIQFSFFNIPITKRDIKHVSWYHFFLFAFHNFFKI